MPKFKVGKGKRYEVYVCETLAVMYEANVIYFTLSELASWAGLPRSVALQRTCDKLVLDGWLSVAPREIGYAQRARTYCLQSPVWLSL